VTQAVTVAVGAIDSERLVSTCAAVVDVASPTGGERACAERIVELLDDAGLDGRLMLLDERSANAWGRLPASGPRAGEGPTLLLYAPIDTLTTGSVGDDVPQVGPGIDGHLLPHAVVDWSAGRITGLGAHNPKGHAACILEAVRALSDAGTPLTGDVMVAFGAGGMPTFAVDDPSDPLARRNTGHGVGASFLLERGVWADAAVIAKSGWFVQHEEVGLAWSDVVVGGTHTYVGARHRLPYRNAIADAATVALHLEERFAGRVDRAGTLGPQSMVAEIDGGWRRTAAFLPESVRLRVDQRLLPDQSPLDAHRDLDALLDELRAGDPDLDVRAELVLAIAGSATPEDHWICEAGRRAWTATTGEEHEHPTDLSGSTDANILRNRGVPTMRVGLPKVHIDGAELGFAEGMNTVDVGALSSLTELLVRTILDVCSRTREELR
jgi:acetylornithine deacetylase/succinyl-diaminopimelate desuccinylase-like protein